MDNMANTVTNEKAVIEQLVVTNVKQDSTISTQAIPILSLSDEFKRIQIRIINKGVIGGRGGRSNDISKFLKYGYFWSHGYKVLYMIPDCKNKK